MTIKEDIKDLVEELNKKGIICFKTDTIWGFSACATDEESIQKLYSIKHRNPDKAFVSLIKKDQNLDEIVKPLNDIQKKLIKKFWPGPLTIVFETKDNLPLVKFYPEKATIALRMPDDELCQSILSKIDYPLPSASVNIEGQPPINDFHEIAKAFEEEDFVLHKPTKKLSHQNKSIASTIVSTVNNQLKILRIGDISQEEILDALK